MSKSKIIRIAINLEDDDAQQFLEVQKFLRIKNRTDVLRYVINWYHREEIKKGEG